MIILGELVEKEVTKLKPTAFKFLSMVKEPAYQISLDKVKKLGLVEKEGSNNMLVKTKTKAKNNIVPKEVKFEKAIYSDAKACEAIMHNNGYSEFEMSETDDHFVAKSKFAADKFKGEESEIILADFDKGVTAIVDTVIEDKAKSAEGEETTEEATEEATEGTEEGETTEGGEAEGTEEKVDPEKSVSEELSLDTNVEESEAEKSFVLDCNGKNTKEVLKAYEDLMEAGSKDCKKYSEYAAYWSDTGSFPEALKAGSFDGSVPGMDEVFEVLKAFTASAFSMQDREAAKKGFDEAAEYMLGLKDLFDKYSMNDLAKAFILNKGSKDSGETEAEKSKSTTVVSEESGKETSNIIDEIKSLFASEMKKSRDKANDIFKDNLETVNSNLVKTAEYIKTKIDNSNTKVEEFSKQLNELAGTESERQAEKIKQVEEDEYLDRKLDLRKGFNLRNAVSG